MNSIFHHSKLPTCVWKPFPITVSSLGFRCIYYSHKGSYVPAIVPKSQTWSKI